MAQLKCDVCLNDYPIELFPDLTKGDICRGCLTGENIKKVDRALREKSKQIAGALSDMTPNQLASGLGSVGDIIAEVYNQFGGPTGYASQLHAVLLELCNRRPLPPAVGHILINIMKLHHTVEQSRKELSLKEMTLEQLKRESEMATIQYIAEAMSDPSKFSELETLMAKYGMSLAPADPIMVIDGVAKKVESLANQPVSVTVAQTTEADTHDPMPSEDEIAEFLKRSM